MIPPVIETQRLTLRGHTRADWPAYRAILMSDRAQYMDGKLDDVGAWSCFASEIASWQLDGHGYWTAALNDTNEAVAYLGIMKPSEYPETELGWMATEAGEGKGYVTEAARAAVEWAFGARGLKTLVSYIDPKNASSIAVAERLGAVRDDSAQKPADNPLVYRHPNPRAA